MASQIYSRYVPPPKKKSTTIQPDPGPAPSTPSIESLKSTPPAKTRPDASSTYVRYVPPSKKKQAPISLPDIPPPHPSPSSPPPKRKHKVLEDHDHEASRGQSKKHKKKSADDSVSTVTVQANDSRNTVLVPAEDYYGLEENGEKGNANQIETGREHQELETPGANGSDAVDEDTVSKPRIPKKRKKDRISDVGSKEIPSEISDPTDHNEQNGEDDAARHKKLLKKRDKSLKKTEELSRKDPDQQVNDPVGESPPLPEAEEVHDLVPLPQPELVPELPATSLIASLPPWLSSPTRVPATSKSSFQNLGLSKDVASALHEKGFREALAVQTAVLPLLLPGKAQQPGDVLVSAATGSGKTLAYVLPMIEDISRNRLVGIQGLIVVPTRELVAQVRQVCESCTSSFSKLGGYVHRPVIGTAVGNETLQAEQDALVDEELVFDPARYDAELKATNASWESSDQPMMERELFPHQEFKSRIPGHVFRPFVKVDVLICTPGRLVEHLKSTPGFSIEHVRWLVVDEADKLLDQSFQQWLDIVMAQIHLNRKCIRDRVRKVILSATMTNDVGQLTSLKLYRPKLVVLEGVSTDSTDSGHQLALPALLKESGVKVEDDIIKPLYLVELLKRANLIPREPAHSGNGSVSDTDSSDSDSESNASTSDTDSDSASDFDSNPDSIPLKASPIAASQTLCKQASNNSTVLIFTKSNETAVRLGRLIALLCPSASSKLGTLTSTTPRQSRQRIISSFSSGKATVLVASDLVSRGLDLPNLAHVINYDVPTSLTSYVHRIGRTARAGKEGHAWTLFTGTEAGWFWREIARSEKVQRVVGSKVERVNIKKEIFDSERQRYEHALEALEKEASSRGWKHEEA
ncbi:hypothetical protein EG329_005790 [Mollisiaceae sp. DMI_Dod_QoI]|nr:hypothetical protein EG329_005790 [Helotiales sp. DMI_Dod_QoI]